LSSHFLTRPDSSFQRDSKSGILARFRCPTLHTPARTLENLIVSCNLASLQALTHTRLWPPRTHRHHGSHVRAIRVATPARDALVEEAHVVVDREVVGPHPTGHCLWIGVDSWCRSLCASRVRQVRGACSPKDARGVVGPFPCHANESPTARVLGDPGVLIHHASCSIATHQEHALGVAAGVLPLPDHAIVQVGMSSMGTARVLTLLHPPPSPVSRTCTRTHTHTRTHAPHSPITRACRFSCTTTINHPDRTLIGNIATDYGIVSGVCMLLVILCCIHALPR
jgi:hypothetical protein